MWGFRKKKSRDKRKEQQGDFGEIGDIDINVCKEPDKYAMSFRKVHRSLGKPEFEQAHEMKNKHTFELGDIVRHKDGTELYIVDNGFTNRYYYAKSLCITIRHMNINGLSIHAADMVRVCNIDDFKLFRKKWFIDLRKYDSGAIAAIVEYLAGKGFSTKMLSPLIFENKQLFMANTPHRDGAHIYEFLNVTHCDKNIAPHNELVFDLYLKPTISGCNFVQNETLVNKNKKDNLILLNRSHQRNIEALHKKINENLEEIERLSALDTSASLQLTVDAKIALLITEASTCASEIAELQKKIDNMKSTVEELSKS